MQFAPGAWRLAAVTAVVAVPLVLLHPVATAVALALAGGVLWFYRDPERAPPAAGVVAPADGRVTVLREEGERVRVGVFMNVTDVHVNRAPVRGTVREVSHEPGAHRPAFSKESDRNEKVRLTVETPDGAAYEVVLIAGWFARRIHPYVETGDEVERGQRIGHIAFGSRADVLLPAGVDREDVQVDEAQTVRAGETVLAPSGSD